MTSGETDLSLLLQHMQPVLHPGVYVFTTVDNSSMIPRGDCIAEIREAEGTTLILPKGTADQQALPYVYEAAWITLQVHSALEAIGLTAAVATALAAAGISCNVVAGYYHDHLFVDHDQAARALAILRALSTPSTTD